MMKNRSLLAIQPTEIARTNSSRISTPNTLTHSLELNMTLRKPFALVLTSALVFFGSSHAYAGNCSDKNTAKSEYKHNSSKQDIVDTAASNQKFSTLVAAVTAAGLVDTLKSDGPFTVFAPTNDAFAALPEGTLNTLLKPENREQLASILKYHVVPGKVAAEDVVKLSTAETALGQSVISR